MRRVAWLLVLCLVGCDRGPVREWTADDHDHAEGAPQPGAQKADPAEVQAQVVEVTWVRQCVVCHGPTGRGDGPNGPMVNAPDITRSEASDEQIAKIILEGKGRMPRFDLPPQTVAGLVQRVRRLRGR